jgi:hypothetical protein
VKARPFLQGAGFATLYVALFAADFLNPTLGDAYHRFFPLTTIYRAIFLLTLILWLIGGLAFFKLERLSPRWRRIFWLLPIVMLPWLFFRSMSVISSESATSTLPIAMLRLGHWTALAFAAIALLLLIVKPKLYDSCVTGFRTCYMVAGFGLFLIIPRIGFHALKSGPPEPSGFQRDGLPVVSPPAPRIVWILMDELSYDQVFDSRQPDVLLPNFHRLAQSSVTFSDLRPPAAAPGPGAATEDILPSLMLGRVIVDLRKPYPGPPSYRSTADGAWQTFNERDTIFATAHSLGWTTGVVGWYNPYCRLLPKVLDRCIWFYSEPLHSDLSGSLSTRKSVVENMVAMMPISFRLNSVMHVPTDDPIQTHIDDYLNVMAQTRNLIQDSRIRFAFIHFPIPHPPGIYDRVHHVIRNDGSYLDNLVLADQSLAALQEAIQSTPSAANTTLIVSSDHSWRQWVWQPLKAEGERASHGGKFDPRPVLMVHLPGSDTGQVIAKPVNVLVVHPILEGLLRGQIRTQADLVDLVNHQSQASQNVQAGN